MSEQEGSPNYRNHNPTGKNQHKDCPPAEDATVVRLLHEYHRKGITNKEKLSELFKTVHGINISSTTINRRKRKLGLYASAATTRNTPDDVKLQLVLDAMAADPERKMGARRIREAIFERTGTMLTREYVTEMVQIHDPPRWKPKKRKTVAAEEGGAGEQNAEMGDWNQPWDGPGTSGLGSDEQGPALEGSVPVAGPSNSGSIRGRRTAVASSVPKYPRRKKDPPVDLMVLAVLQKTEEKLRVYYSTQNPFPTSEEREAAIAQHFSYALAECGHNESWYKLTDLNMVSLRQCDLNLRTSIHQAIHRYLPAAYGLVINPDTMQEQQNRARVAWLLEDSRYVYELPDRREGRFQHPVISEIIHNVWFNSTHSIGCTYQEFFNPIRNETLALILTTIRYDLLRWQTGILVESVVQADETRIYEEFLQALLQFDTGLMAPLWRRYRASIFRRALVIAGIGPGSALVRPLTTEEMQREHEHLRIRFEYDCVREHP